MRNIFVEHKSNGEDKINFMSVESVGNMLYGLYQSAKQGIEITEVTIIKMK